MDRKVLKYVGIFLIVGVVVGLALFAVPDEAPKYRGASYTTVSCDLVDLTGDTEFDIMMCDGGLTVPLGEIPTEMVRSE